MDAWSTTERLLLAQATHRFTENWLPVSRIIKSHPALSSEPVRPPTFFQQKNCAKEWSAMMEQAELAKRNKRSNDPSSADLSPAARFSKQLYAQRTEELKGAIARNETRYRDLTAVLQSMAASGDELDEAYLRDIVEKFGLIKPAVQPADAPSSSSAAMEEEEFVQPEQTPQHPTAEPSSPPSPSLAPLPLTLPPGKKAAARVSPPIVVTAPLEPAPHPPPQTPLPVAPTSQVQAAPVPSTPTPAAVAAPAVVEGPSMSTESSPLLADSPRLSDHRKASRSRRPSESAPEGAVGGGDSADDEAEKARKKSWKKSILMVYERIASHRYISPFLVPVRRDGAEDYYQIIKRPMDLTTIRSNITDGKITTTAEFQRDVYLMLANAYMYNSEYHEIYEMAEEVFRDTRDIISSLRSLETTQPFGSVSTTAGAAVLGSSLGATAVPADDEVVGTKRSRKSDQGVASASSSSAAAAAASASSSSSTPNKRARRA